MGKSLLNTENMYKYISQFLIGVIFERDSKLLISKMFGENNVKVLN